MDESAESLLDDEEGKLALALRTWLDDVGSLLGDTFDETSKKSAIAKLEKVLEQARDEQVKAVTPASRPRDDESPLGRWRSEIVKTVKEQGESIEEALNDLREQLAIGERRRRRTRRLHQGLRLRGHRPGGADADRDRARGRARARRRRDRQRRDKVGDIVVTLNPTQTPGRSLRYVIEVKDKSMTLKKALDELDARDAEPRRRGRVMVFASQASARSSEPFQWFDHKALVVLDKDEPDESALRLACLWARWTVRREEAEGAGTVDVARVQSLLDSARLSLKTATTIKGDHKKAHNAIDQASLHLGSLVSDLSRRSACSTTRSLGDPASSPNDE